MTKIDFNLIPDAACSFLHVNEHSVSHTGMMSLIPTQHGQVNMFVPHYENGESFSGRYGFELMIPEIKEISPALATQVTVNSSSVGKSFLESADKSLLLQIVKGAYDHLSEFYGGELSFLSKLKKDAEFVVDDEKIIEIGTPIMCDFLCIYNDKSKFHTDSFMCEWTFEYRFFVIEGRETRGCGSAMPLKNARDILEDFGANTRDEKQRIMLTLDDLQ